MYTLNLSGADQRLFLERQIELLSLTEPDLPIRDVDDDQIPDVYELAIGILDNLVIGEGTFVRLEKHGYV